MYLQYTANTAIQASAYVLIALSFHFVYRAYGFLNVAHAIPYVAAPYITYSLIRACGCHLLIAALGGVLVSALFGCLLDVMLFWQLRQRNASGAVCILASLGAYVIFQHGLSLAFGNDTLSYYDSVLPSSIARFGIVVTTPQVLILSAAGLSLACALAMLLGSRWGLLFRAVVSDADLSFALGISRNAVILCSVIAGSTLAGIAGILSCYDTHLEPSMGMNAFLMAVVVVLVAGKESILGIMLAALIVSVARTVGVWLFSSQWQNIAAFLVLLIVFAVRPQGLLGRQHSSFRE